MTIPANPSFTGSDSGTSYGGGDTFDKVPVIGTYLQSAGLSLDEDHAKVWPYSHTSAINCSQTAFGGFGSVEIWVGCKCVNKNSDGTQTLAVASPYETAVTALLESGTTGGDGGSYNVYCATASR